MSREEVDRPLRRDGVEHPVCRCAHLRSGHRIDLKREACVSPACGCQQYRHGWSLVRETRWVRVYPELPAD